MSSASKWADLRTRVLSGVAVLAVGISAIFVGDLALQVLAALVAALCAWELARMTEGQGALPAPVFGAAAGLSMYLALDWHGSFGLLILALPALLGLPGARRDRVVFIAYSLAIMLGIYGFVAFRDGHGLWFTVWLTLVVVASDMLGYFAGRLIGGPKFWPRLSPKKTWSGTAAGWLGAALIGAAFAIWDGQPMILPLFSALTAFAAQMGDIAESAIKRRAGVKDSSNLIPGHGGLLDRFDGMIGAAVFVLVWGLLGLPLPQFGV